MTGPRKARVLYVIVCGAGPAPDVGRLVSMAQERGWDVQVIATPAGIEFIDIAALETQTGRPVRSQYRKPGGIRSPRADAIIVAPATYNTINQCRLVKLLDVSAGSWVAIRGRRFYPFCVSPGMSCA